MLLECQGKIPKLNRMMDSIDITKLIKFDIKCIVSKTKDKNLNGETQLNYQIWDVDDDGHF